MIGLKAIKKLGKEVVFAEPAYTATYAALDEIDYEEDEKIALMITGSGLKDPEAAQGKEDRKLDCDEC